VLLQEVFILILGHLLKVESFTLKSIDKPFLKIIKEQDRAAKKNMATIKELLTALKEQNLENN
jgi:hypothetical protein